MEKKGKKKKLLYDAIMGLKAIWSHFLFIFVLTFVFHLTS